MVKLGRNYLLRISQLNGDIREIEPPFTMEFDVRRNILHSANVASFRIYNLAAAVRNEIVKDISDIDLNLEVYLYAGYQNNIPLIFQGNIKQAWSHRQRVDFITEIQCYDAGFAFVNGKTNQNFSAGTPRANILRAIINDLPGVTEGSIGVVEGSTSRGSSYSGRTTDILAELSSGNFFIDNGKAHVLGESECIQGSIDEISAATGLLGTPIREQNIIHLEMMFEPRLLLGQKIRLDSKTAPNRVGDYKIIDIHHQGVISDAVCGDAITRVSLAYGASLLTVV